MCSNTKAFPWLYVFLDFIQESRPDPRFFAFLPYSVIFLLFRGGEPEACRLLVVVVTEFTPSVRLFLISTLRFLRSGLLRSNTWTVLSSEQEASRPSGNTVTDVTLPACTFSVATHCSPSGLLGSQTFTIPLLAQETSRPSGNTVTESCQPGFPLSVNTHCCPSGLLRSHTFMVPSAEVEASRPSGNTVNFTQLAYTLSVATHCCPSGLLTSHTFMVWSSEQEASRPLGNNLDRSHTAGMPIQRCHAFLPLGLAQIPHLYALVNRAGSQPPVGQYHDRIHVVSMLIQGHHSFLPLGLAQIPHLYGLVC